MKKGMLRTVLTVISFVCRHRSAVWEWDRRRSRLYLSVSSCAVDRDRKNQNAARIGRDLLAQSYDKAIQSIDFYGDTVSSLTRVHDIHHLLELTGCFQSLRIFRAGTGAESGNKPKQRKAVVVAVRQKGKRDDQKSQLSCRGSRNLRYGTLSKPTDLLFKLESEDKTA